MKPAAFLDRDGTIIELVHHLTNPGDVKLLPGVGEAIDRLKSYGYECILVTNQSVVGRGLLDERGLSRIHDEVRRQLQRFGTELDAIYYCPFAPRQTDPTIVEHPDRKPGPGMILRAAKERNIDLSKSWVVGDSISDVLASQNAECHASILVPSSHMNISPDYEKFIQFKASDLISATDIIIDHLSQESR